MQRGDLTPRQAAPGPAVPGAWPAQTVPRQWPASSAGSPAAGSLPRQAGPRDPDRDEPARPSVRPDAQPHGPVIDPGHPHMGMNPVTIQRSCSSSLRTR